MVKTWLAKLLTIKAAALLTVTAAGGVALAATTGTLPNPLAHSHATAPGAAPATGRPTTASHPGAGPSVLPSASLLGLCHAYTAGAGAEHGKALTDPAFTALITTAGGADKVDGYCKTLLASAPGDAPSHPSGPPDTAHPTGAPTSTPSTAGQHPTGAPTGHPSGAPSSHPGR